MKKAFLIVFLVTTTVFVTYGQNILTLDAAIGIGLANNWGISISKNNLRVAANNFTPGNAGMLPRIDVNAVNTVPDAPGIHPRWFGY